VTLPALKRDEEILWRYLFTINQTKPCPRMTLVDLANRNLLNLDMWLYHLIDEHQLVKDEWIEDRLYYRKTEKGETLYMVMKYYRESVSLLIPFTGNKMKPTRRRHKPPPRPSTEAA